VLFAAVLGRTSNGKCQYRGLYPAAAKYAWPFGFAQGRDDSVVVGWRRAVARGAIPHAPPQRTNASAGDPTLHPSGQMRPPGTPPCPTIKPSVEDGAPGLELGGGGWFEFAGLEAGVYEEADA